MSTKPDIQAIENYYDSYSTWYEGERREGYYSIINDLEFEKIEKAVTNKTVLEIGCGTGLILERTTKVAERAVGIDLSSDMAEFCASQKGLETKQASATELPFDNATFDVVYSMKVLPHIPNIEKAMLEVERVLKPGGKGYLEFYNSNSFKRISYFTRTKGDKDEPVYIRHDTAKSFCSYFPASFKVNSLRGIRTFGITKHFYTLPVIGKVFRWLERKTCDTKLGKSFGGYVIVEITKNAS